MSKSNLIKKFEDKSAVIGIVGLGYVGLPLALAFCEKGFQVWGFEIDQDKVNKLNKGQNYIRHLNGNRISQATQSRNLIATTDFKKASSVDAFIICVPTPLDKHHAPDMSFVRSTLNSIKPYLHKDQIISLESTVYPGATAEEVVPTVESRGLKVGEDVFVVFSPEREDPGNSEFHTSNIPKVVGGITPVCLEVGRALYHQVISKTVPVSSTQAAEMTKLLENIYRAVNIGLVNELKIVADRMGINIWDVIDAASTKPFGYTPFYPGPGLGGHCIPIDPFYLTWKAKEYGVHARFIELAGQTNCCMPAWVVQKVVDTLNEKGKSINQSKILLLGLAYKKNIDDLRESPAAELIKLLHRKGAQISVSDPYISFYRSDENPELRFESLHLNPQLLSTMDCVLVATDHDSFDYQMIKEHSALIVDTRGRYRAPSDKIILA